MTKILGISGSLRAGSYNPMLLRAAAAMAPAGHDHRGRDVTADGHLIVTPEYNNSIPGVLRNAIDWLSRPPAEIPRTFTGRPVGIIGATPGQGATNLAQAAWLPVLRTLRTLPWSGGRLGVSSSGNVFDAQGAITDDKVRGQLEKYATGFAKLVARAWTAEQSAPPRRVPGPAA